jgi:integrase
MRITFNVRSELKSKRSNMLPVAMTITHAGFKIRKLISNVKALESDWSTSTQRIKPNKKHEPYNNYAEYNAILDDLSQRLNRMWSRRLLNQNSEITKEELIEFINGAEQSSEESDIFRLIECFEVFIEQSKSHKAPRTITGYKTVKGILQSFFDKTNLSQDLNDIDLKFFDRLRNYCFEEKGYRNNFFARITTNIKTVMKWAEERGYHSNLSYTKFIASESDIEVIYLTMDELMKLYNHKFEKKVQSLEKVRDIYCFSCFTGLRYSDLASLKRSNVFEDHLNLTIVKTRDQDHIIPLNKFALEILERYKEDFGGPLPMISSQKLNKNIKKACEIVGINEPINITRFSGSKRIESVKPKHKLITIHTGRKTFITNSLVLGMSQVIVKNITGHKSESSFRKYVKISDDVKKTQIDQFWNQIKTK